MSIKSIYVSSPISSECLVAVKCICAWPADRCVPWTDHLACGCLMLMLLMLLMLLVAAHSLHAASVLYYKSAVAVAQQCGHLLFRHRHCCTANIQLSPIANSTFFTFENLKPGHFVCPYRDWQWLWLWLSVVVVVAVAVVVAVVVAVGGFDFMFMSQSPLYLLQFQFHFTLSILLFHTDINIPLT